MVKIDARFKLLEPLPASLLAVSSAPGACSSDKELTLRGFDVRLETDPLAGEFFADVANPRREDRDLLAAAYN